MLLLEESWILEVSLSSLRRLMSAGLFQRYAFLNQ